MYLKSATDESLVDRVREIVKRYAAPALNHLSDFGEAISEKKWSLFPRVRYTERPDVVVAGLLEGRVAVLASGSSEAMIAPISFASLFQAPDDYYLDPARATITRGNGARRDTRA